MSCIRKIKTFNIVKNIEVKYGNKQEIDKLVLNIKNVLNQKFNKINTLIKNMILTINGDKLIINDCYCICPELKSILNSFNFNVKVIDKNTYQITDDFISILNKLDEQFDIKSIFANATIINCQKTNEKTNDIFDLIKKIRKDGSYIVQQKRKVKRVYYDDIPNDFFETKTKFKNNNDLILKKIQKFVDVLNDKFIKANLDLQNGTIALIKYRAKQMGYSIKQTSNNNNVQLVLERID